MSHADKSALYQALKAEGYEFERQYREYTTTELSQLCADFGISPEVPVEAPAPAAPAESFGAEEGRFRMSDIPFSDEPIDEWAGVRAYSENNGEVPLRRDSQGRIWFREEVRKPAIPKERVRRHLQYIDSGAKTVQATAGNYTETFEVAGDARRISEVRITLPSYQVGVYATPKFPFRVHIYNDMEGFDLFEVQQFYGAADLVPPEIKRVYVENDLCYDIMTTIRAINDEDRRLQLTRNQGF